MGSVRTIVDSRASYTYSHSSSEPRSQGRYAGKVLIERIGIEHRSTSNR